MRSDLSKSWLDSILEINSSYYLIIPIIIGVIICSIYFAIGRMIELNWDAQTEIMVALMGIIIAFQLIGMRYLLSTKEAIFRELNHLYADRLNDLLINNQQESYKSFMYYVLMSIIILPFYLIDWISPDYTLSEYFLEYYTAEPNIWTLIFDIYNNLVGLLILFLFFNIIWTLINMAWALRDVSIRSSDLVMNTNIFEANSRLGAIRDSLLKIGAYYFICVSLIISSYINFSEYIYEIIFLMLFLLIGLTFFFSGFEAVNSLMKRQVGFVLDKINKKDQEYIERLLSIEPDGDPSQKNEETNFVSNMLDALQKQREALVKTDMKIYDFRSIISIIGAFFLPILTDIAKRNLNLIFESGDIINQGATLLNSSIHKII